MPLTPRKKRILLLIGVTVLLGAVEYGSGRSWSYSDYNWGDGVVSHMLASPVMYWNGANWFTLIGYSAAVYLIVKSTRA